MRDNKNEEHESSKGSQFDVTELTSFFLGAAFLSPIIGILFVKGFKISFQNLGTFGDFLGGSTVPFLTFASILYVLKSINLQKEDLAESKIALQEEIKTSQLTRFENTFYNLINEIRLDIKNFNFNNGSETLSGYDYLEYLMQRYKEEMNKRHKNMESSKDYKNLINEYSDEKFYRIYGKIIEESYYSLETNTHYNVLFDHLQQVFFLIERNEKLLDENEISFYLNYLFSITRDQVKYLYLLKASFTFDQRGIHSIEKLKLLEYVNQYSSALSNPTDFKFINFVVKNKFDILPPLYERIK